MQWICKEFYDLSVIEFYNILKLRINVFVVEQHCVYKELDDKDQKAYHLFAFETNQPNTIIAYSRIFKPGDYYKEAAFGRVVVHSDFRNKKIGYDLIEKTVDFIDKNFKGSSIKISAQTYLKRFYESFNFKQISEEYLDDGIPHIDMLKS